MSRPTPALLGEAHCILAYLHHTRDLGLRYESGQRELHAFTDSDWATRRSTSGNTIQWQGCTIEWASTQQTSVALSYCEAEIMAASEAAKSTSYYRQLFEELGFAAPGPTTIYMDNKAAIDLAYNPEHHRRTKHITRRHSSSASSSRTRASPYPTSRWLTTSQTSSLRSCPTRTSYASATSS